MYPPSSHRPPGLARYGSAPGSLLASIAESVVAGGELPASAESGNGLMSRFYTGDSPCLTSDPSCRSSASPGLGPNRSNGVASTSLHHSPTGIPADGTGGPRGGGAPLLRHSSSPAGFLSHLMVDHGFSGPSGGGNCSQAGSDGVYAMASTQLKPQRSFSRQDSLSLLSEISIPDIGESITSASNSDEAAGKVGHSYISNSFQVGSWDDTIMFSAPPSKQKDDTGEYITSFSNIESQASLEMGSIEKFLQIQEDSIPCKVRAKRGCATHPRSIAERERRTRISKKLRKLQELVPNMDKQTNTSDMLDLAVHYIKELQVQVKKLNQEQAKCTCASKQEII